MTDCRDRLAGIEEAAHDPDTVSIKMTAYRLGDDTPFVRSIYKGFKISTVKCSRAINSNAAKRGDVDEVIVVGGY